MSSDTFGDIYIAFLFLSGILLLVLGIGGFGQKTSARVIDTLFGFAFLGYGYYLAFIFEGGSYRIFFYAFVVPIFAVIQLLKARKERQEQAAALNAGQYPGQFPGQPPVGFPGVPPQGQQFQAPPQPFQGQPAPGQPAPGQPAPGQSAPSQALPPQAPPGTYSDPTAPPPVH